MDGNLLFESFKRDVTCLMCLAYFKDPVIVKCGHTFCKECLLKHWKEAPTTPIPCPDCKANIEFGDSFQNRRLQNVVMSGKMLRPYLLKSPGDLAICKKHGKEETFFCEEDHRPLCGICFLSTEQHREHKVLPLEMAACLYTEKLQATWDVLKRKQQQFQTELDCEEMRRAQWEMEGQALQQLVSSEYEKLYQFLLEQSHLSFQGSDKEARDYLAAEENKDSQSPEVIHLQVMSEEQPMEMVKMEGQAMRQSIKSELEKKHWFLSQEKELHLQRLKQEVQDTLATFEETKAKMAQQMHSLQAAMSEIEQSFAKLPIEILRDAKALLQRNEELLLQNPVHASPTWTRYPIPGMAEMLLTFHRDITLDPATANPHLTLSEDLKSVGYDSVPQDVPNNPRRFNFALRVLATQSFTSGKHYWEVEVGNKTQWEVGIFKESTRRKGAVRKLPGDMHTLVACPFENHFCLWYSHHNLQVSQPIPKVGIFLDYDRGHIAFYNATDATLIYSPPNVAFHGPLRPCFVPCFPEGKDTSGSLRICPRINQQNVVKEDNH